MKKRYRVGEISVWLVVICRWSRVNRAKYRLSEYCILPPKLALKQRNLSPSRKKKEMRSVIISGFRHTDRATHQLNLENKE